MTAWADAGQGEVHVLLVEDSEDDADLIHRALASVGLASHLAWLRDGQEAVDFLVSHHPGGTRHDRRPPRVILLDLKIPKIGGLEVLSRLRADPLPQLAAVPVVVVTSSPQDRDIREAHVRGANGYVVKPVEYAGFKQVMTQTALFWLTINKPLADAAYG
jgi:two-component system, response regulator